MSNNNKAPTFATPTENWAFNMSQRIRIKLQSYDNNLVDKSAERIVKTVRSTGAVVTVPIPFPTHKKIFTVLTGNSDNTLYCLLSLIYSDNC